MLEYLIGRKMKLMNKKSGVSWLYIIVFILVLLISVLVVFFPSFFRMKAGVYSVSCSDMRKKIRQAIIYHNSGNLQKQISTNRLIDVDFLKENDYVDKVYKCPDRGRFFLTDDMRVVCTYHSEGYAIKKNETD